jgi:threonine dehydratase
MQAVAIGPRPAVSSWKTWRGLRSALRHDKVMNDSQRGQSALHTVFSMQHPTLSDIEAARDRIASEANVTPLIGSPAIDQRLGGRVLFKCETLQRVGAFKFRGAYNAIARLDRAAAPGGVVACSSGNHAQGVAEAARLLGYRAVIVMPADAPAIKIERTKAAGAEVVLYDRETESREEIALELQRERQAAFIPPFDHFDVITGQGTVGLELMRQAAALGVTPDIVLAPCSGAGLSTGIATAVKALSPKTEVYAVEPEAFDDLARSFETGKREQNRLASGSICDALMANSTSDLTYAIAKEKLAGSLRVSDAEVKEAMRVAFAELKLVVEPGGAAGLAALLAGRISLEGRTAVVVLSGGNVDPIAFAEILAGG